MPDYEEFWAVAYMLALLKWGEADKARIEADKALMHLKQRAH